MAFYKLCDCGTKNCFEHRGLAPRKCEKCGRSLLEFSVVDEHEEPVAIEIAGSESTTSADLKIDGFYYSLDTMNGDKQINIPLTGGTVGRAALGAGILEPYRAISREHIHVTYRGRIGLLIEDLSKYGTFINDEQIVKGTTKFAHDGDIVKLYNFELRVKKHMEAST